MDILSKDEFDSIVEKFNTEYKEWSIGNNDGYMIRKGSLNHARKLFKFAKELRINVYIPMSFITSFNHFFDSNFAYISANRIYKNDLHYHNEVYGEKYEGDFCPIIYGTNISLKSESCSMCGNSIKKTNVINVTEKEKNFGGKLYELDVDSDATIQIYYDSNDMFCDKKLCNEISSWYLSGRDYMKDRDRVNFDNEIEFARAYSVVVGNTKYNPDNVKVGLLAAYLKFKADVLDKASKKMAKRNGVRIRNGNVYSKKHYFGISKGIMYRPNNITLNSDDVLLIRSAEFKIRTRFDARMAKEFDVQERIIEGVRTKETYKGIISIYKEGQNKNQSNYTH